MVFTTKGVFAKPAKASYFKTPERSLIDQKTYLWLTLFCVEVHTIKDWGIANILTFVLSKANDL